MTMMTRTMATSSNDIMDVATLSKQGKRFLHIAVGVALMSKCRYRHGAVVVKGGRIVGASPNLHRNDARFVDWKSCSTHAEAAALKKAGYPRRATVYVARVGRNNPITRLSKPCEQCAELINSLQCKAAWTT